MLDLVRMSPRRLFPPGGEDLYRQVARLTDLSPGTEVLDVASGKGIPLEYFVREYEVQGTGVEADPALVAEAEDHARGKGFGSELSYQEASPDDLPFRDETFDVVVGELGLAASVDPATAVRELARVTRPGGQVVLIQLVWKGPVEKDRRQVLAEHLGARPLMMVELRRILKDARVESLHIEDWTDEETAFRRQVKKPFPDFAELFSLGEKLGILRRAWRKWGWGGVRTVFQREAEVHSLLTRERLLGLSLVRGMKMAIPVTEDDDPSGAAGPGAPGVEGVTGDETDRDLRAEEDGAEAASAASEEPAADPPGSSQEPAADPTGSSQEPEREKDPDLETRDAEKERGGEERWEESGNLQTTGLPLFGPDVPDTDRDPS